VNIEDAEEGMNVVPSQACPPYMRFSGGILVGVQKDDDGQVIHPPLLVKGVFPVTGAALVSMYLQEVEPAGDDA